MKAANKPQFTSPNCGYARDVFPPTTSAAVKKVEEQKQVVIFPRRPRSNGRLNLGGSRCICCCHATFHYLLLVFRSATDPRDTAASQRWRSKVAGEILPQAMHWCQGSGFGCISQFTRRQPLVNHQPVHLLRSFQSDFGFSAWSTNSQAKIIDKNYFSRNTARASLCPSWHHKGPIYSLSARVPGVCRLLPGRCRFFPNVLKLQQVQQSAKTQQASSQTDWKQSGCFLDVCAALERMNWLWLSPGCRMVIDKWGLCEIFNWCHTCTDVVKHRGIQLLSPAIPKKETKNKVKNNANSKITVITCCSPLLPVPFALPLLHLFNLHRQNAQIQPC